MSGPLKGTRIIEMAGIGPGPFACMLLADLGAEVIRIDRAGGGEPSPNPADVMGRGRRSLALNLKQPEAVEVALMLIESADALIEGFRPGVMEKLGLGPETCLARNPKLVFGRMTGWGQHGPLARAAGHDINYIALTGALAAIGRKEGGPVPPLNLLGDFGGGSLYMVMGVLAAMLEARQSGQGQVVDVAITDGVISLMSAIHGFAAMGVWEEGRQNNMLDGAAHYYDTYECADGKWVAVGAIEPQFYALLLDKLGLPSDTIDFAAQFDRARWPVLKRQLADIFITRDRAYWCELLEGTDACFAPVLDTSEARNHPHNVARGSFIERDGVLQSAPAPRFSRNSGEAGGTAPGPGQHSGELLRELGYDEATSARLREKGVVGGI